MYITKNNVELAYTKSQKSHIADDLSLDCKQDFTYFYAPKTKTIHLKLRKIWLIIKDNPNTLIVIKRKPINIFYAQSHLILSEKKVKLSLYFLSKQKEKNIPYLSV